MLLDKVKIKAKLLLSFSVVILFLIFIIGIGVVQVNTISRDSYIVYQQNVKPLESLEKFKAEYAELRRLATVAVTNGAAADIDTIEKGIKALHIQYDLVLASARSYEKVLAEIGAGQDRSDMISNIIWQIQEEYWPLLETICTASRIGDIKTMVTTIDKAVVVAEKINNEISAPFASRMAEAAKNSVEITNIANQSRLALIVAGAIAIVFSLIVALYVGEMISRKITVMKDTVMEIAAGNLNFQLKSEAKDELGDLARGLSIVVETLNNITFALSQFSENFRKGDIYYTIDIENFTGVFKTVMHDINEIFRVNVDETVNFLNCMGEFSDGNFDADLPKMPGKKVLMNNTIDSVRAKLKSVSGEINTLVRAAASGNLTDRADIHKYKGDWVEIMDGLNRLMEAVATPISESEEVLSQVAVGKFEHRITGDYHGAFLLMKNSINNMCENMDSCISDVSGTLRAVSQNDLNRLITREYVGKFTDIKDAINNIIDKFNGVVSDISSAADQTASGARQISESSMTLAQGATQQASAVQELTATMELINHNTTQNAVNAANARGLSERSRENAIEGDREMKNMLSSMNGIKDSSNSISKIIKVIDDIAFQTNMLALNAAVEAARAGAQGKGFAVVAEEVRNLAGKSQDAARETAQLIEESINRVGEGTNAADKAANALRTIVDDVVKVAEIINGIAIASEQQTHAVGQVREGLMQITEVAQSNSATSEESASASQELSSQSEMLQNLVSVFKLRK